MVFRTERQQGQLSNFAGTNFSFFYLLLTLALLTSATSGYYIQEKLPLVLEDGVILIQEPIQLESAAGLPSKRSQMLRLARNLPPQEKMYQISNIGDLPMFRFG